MYAYGGGWDEAASIENSLINYGTIEVTSTADVEDGGGYSYAQAYAYGMTVESSWEVAGENQKNELINYGSIDVSTSAYSTASGDWASTYSYSPAAGMDVYSEDLNNELTNSGSIDVYAYAYTTVTGGDDAESYSEGYASNYAMGINAWADNGTNTLSNYGTITVEAVAEAYGSNAYAEAYAEGMYAGVSGEGSNIVTNEEGGIINVTATATNGNAYAYGIDVYGMASYVMVVSAIDGDDPDADAPDANDTDAGITSTINNFGTINVSASATNGNAYAYQAYVWAGTANVGTWTLELGETYGTDGTGYYVFGVNGYGTLNFGVDGKGATFIITNESSDGTIYAVKDMVNIESYTEENGDLSDNEDIGEWVSDGTYTTYEGTVTGYIAEVQSKYDFVEWSIVNEDGSAYAFGDDAYWEDQYITGEVNLTEDNSPTQEAATQTVSTVTGHMTNLGKIIAVQTPSATVASSASPVPSSVPSGPSSAPSGPNSGPHGGSHEESLATSTMYADAGGTFSDAGTGTSYVAPQAPLWKAFLMPFYSYTSENGGDYSTNMMGLALGASRSVGDDMTLGFHASLSRALSDSDYTDSTATSYALGVHGLYNIDGALYVRGQLSGFYSESDMDIRSTTGADPNKANADMDTYGFYAQVAAGYDMVLTPQHRVTPEVAISYMYAHMEGFDTAYYDSTGAQADTFSMDSENYDAVYADASVRWTGSYDIGKGTLHPTVKAGIRQALTDPEVSSTMTFNNGLPSPTHSDLNETAFTCEAGLAWDMGDVDVSLTYTGEFGDVEYTHMGMFKVEWSF